MARTGVSDSFMIRTLGSCARALLQDFADFVVSCLK